jgi:hypothetical protein
MPSNWFVFDRVRTLIKNHNIFQSERTLQDQTQLDRIAHTGNLDLDQQSILDQTNVQINRLERYRDYELMAQTGEISLALDLYADEASLVDSERKHTIIIRARNKRLKRELEELFFNTLQWDTHCRPTIRYLCKYGDFGAEIIPNENRTCVSSLRFMNIYNFTRIETRFGDLVGFYYQDPIYPEPIFMHPWQVMHTRLTSFENIYHPYGISILDGGRKAFKQLRLMEDSALIYRITRAPERRKFKIPVGNIPTNQIPEYIAAIARTMKRQRFYNPTTGTFDERYSPLIQEDDYFLPVRADGTGPDVDSLPGAENLDQIADIEYFKKKMIAPLKIPFARVGLGEGAGEQNEKSLSQSHAEFAKAVQWIQREVAKGLTKVALVHLALRGYSVEDLKGFEITLTATSALEELYRIETWQTRADVMATLKDLGWFPKDWIVTHFTDLSPDEIEDLKDVEAESMAPSGGGGGLGGLDLGMDDETPEIPGQDNDLLAPDAEEDTEPPLEGYDYASEKRVINEMRIDKRLRSKKILEKLNERELNSGFDYFMTINELDALSKGNNINDSNYGTNSDPLVLIESTIDIEEANGAKNIAKALISEELANYENADDSEITIYDLPPR